MNMNIYTRYYKQILTHGLKAKPRGKEVKFIKDVTYSYIPGYFPRRPHDNPAIGLMEGLQMIAGIFDHDAIARVAPRAQLDLFTGQSAYGPRIEDQMLQRVVLELQNDPDSRRAIVMINHPEDTPTSEPCTTSIQFHVTRPGLVSSTACMRSSDAVWGLPYDIIQFGMITYAVARAFKYDAGDAGIQHGCPVASSVMIGNAHVYEATRLPKGDTFRTWRFIYPFQGKWETQRKSALDCISLIDNAKDIMDLFQLQEVSA
jgi:hypothetical protein